MFIRMIQGSCTRQDEIRDVVNEWSAVMAEQPGWLGGTYG